ncbi:hypothetical protein AO385_0740 [Moraxella catarrhalis]|uniref:Tail fibre protein gp37 trimerization region domain-containing protein n=2 Tax=Moraxella catarrhalis TaxID=480 RepID=A0A198UMK5_MORCA|nr:hypothetical protein AO384_0611 [Moraxella catarrhalis]OAU98805.1 hypothetical protein AO383_0371 [Moraxella catarrhalis]OAV02895.1 hypothetical protein AO385_0740 [Moraxella catarrhalis]
MGAGAEVRHNVTKTQFGDGYAQRVSHGINNKRTDWSGTKVGDYETVIKPIADFLDAHGGVKPFLWTNPHGETKQYVCQDYQVTQRKGNFWQISLKFEQSNSDGSSAPLLDFGNQNSGTDAPNLPQSALDDINKKIQDEIERSTQKDDAHDKAIQSLNTSKTSLSKAIDEIKEQLAGVSSAPASVAWDSITGKPSSFNPSSHSHAWNSITDKPQSFNPSSHTHQVSDITDLQTILSKYATKDEIPRINTDGLTIDTSNLATKTSVETLANKVTEASEALKSETKLRANSIAAIDSKITAEVDRSSKKDADHDDEIASLKRTKADLSHTHTMSEVTDLSAELERYALKAELDNISVDTSHLATKSSVDELSEQIATKAPNTHTHSFNDISNKPTTLAGYGITDAISSNTDVEITSLLTINKSDSYIQGKTNNTRKWYVGKGSSFSDDIQLHNFTHSTQLNLTNNKIVASHDLYVNDSKVITASDTTAFVTPDALNQGLATKAAINHQHTIAEVSELQSILNSKLDSNASAISAQKLTTPRRINGIAFDGTQDITLPTTTNVSWSAISNKPANFTPSAHRHVIADITNLQRELDSKANSNHSHTIAQVAGLSQALGDKASRDELVTNYALKSEISSHSSLDVKILTGLLSHGSTIPLPQGFTENQCKWLVSVSQTNLEPRTSWAGHHCYTLGRVVRVGYYHQNSPWDKRFIEGTANYIIIGVK